MLIALLTVLLTLVLAKWWYDYARIPSKFPDGPFGLPIIGYLGIAKAPNLIEAFKEWEFFVHKRITKSGCRSLSSQGLKESKKFIREIVCNEKCA